MGSLSVVQIENNQYYGWFKWMKSIENQPFQQNNRFVWLSSEEKIVYDNIWSAVNALEFHR